MAASGQYLFAQKIDGNWSRAIITPERNALQTRGISVKTKTYGEIQDKVLFWNDIVNAFKDTKCVFLGEIFRQGDIDRGIGAVLRCLTDKAIARQKDNPLHLYVFDVLCYDGIELLDTPFEERIQYIPKIISRINSPLVEGAKYIEMDENFFEYISDIFAAGGEGAVVYKKTALYKPGARGPHAWDSCKVKQEITNDIDCLITGIEPPTRFYTGKEIEHWRLWQNTRSGQLVEGEYFKEYQAGQPYEPVTKNFFYNFPSAIQTSVYDKKGNLIPLCKLSGLTDELRMELRDNFKEWYLCPIAISGMMISTAQADEDGVGISIRHPLLRSIRKGDIEPKDCTLEKILC